MATDSPNSHNEKQTQRSCRICAQQPDFTFTMAFQPVVDLRIGAVRGYEALVRGTDGEGAGTVMAQLTPATIYNFDQACRIKALELASALGSDRLVSINFLPNAVYEPMSCIQATLEVAGRLGWPLNRIMFEITETEWVRDRRHLQRIIDAYRETGFITALDDFGAGYANLDLLVDLRPDFLKIDRALLQNIDSDERRQGMVQAVIAMAARLDIELIAEGIETVDEARWLYRNGIIYHQGFYYARPGFESLPTVAEEWIDAVRA